MSNRKNVVAHFSEEQDGRDGSFLAAVSESDVRDEIPRRLFVRSPLKFVIKFCFAIAVVAVASLSVVYHPAWYMFGVVALVNGLMFSHLIELQHECLHGHSFNSPALNRLFGVMCGVFMMVSPSHYRYDHLRHHAYLGTDENLEHFNYRFQNLDTKLGFARALFDLSRYKQVFSIFWFTLTNQSITGVHKPQYEIKIKQENCLFFALLAGSVIYSVAVGSWFFALVWWIPAVVVSEAVHFLIEMPEHFGLNTQDNPNVLTNTRSIKTNRLVHWFVNGNDMHTAHHYHHAVPMCNIRELHKLIENKIDVYEKSYIDFYKAVLRGEIKQSETETCMTY